MSLGLYALFAALPLISAGLLLVGFRMPAKKLCQLFMLLLRW